MYNVQYAQGVIIASALTWNKHVEDSVAKSDSCHGLSLQANRMCN